MRPAELLVSLGAFGDGRGRIELSRRILDNAPVGMLLIVVLSGFVSKGVRDAALENGAVACIDKSISARGLIDELFTVVSSPLMRGRSRSATS